MTSILASISGHFGKALMLGAFLPATVFMILWTVFIEPIIPAVSMLLEPLGTFSEEWPVLAAIFIIVVLTGLLYNLNIPIIRFYEGYPWKDSYLGRWRTILYSQKFREEQDRLNGMRTLLRSMPPKDPEYAAIRRNWSAADEAFRKTYPNKELLILPTRMGNVIRSFERYPDEQYGMESILLWTRLVSVIDKDYSGVITDAKTSLDFMLNSSLLSAVLAFAVLILGLIFPGHTLTTSALLISWLVKIALFFILAYIFYYGSISRAGAWGETVKSAFDLYRWNLLETLGYTQKPKSPAAERNLWRKISIQMIYGDHPQTGAHIDYAQPTPNTPPFAASPSPGVRLSLSRGVIQLEDPRRLQVVLQVTNPDPDRTAKEVVITDEVPQGYEYMWGSAASKAEPVWMEGANPFHFSIGDLHSQESVSLSYTILRRDVA